MKSLTQFIGHVLLFSQSIEWMVSEADAYSETETASYCQQEIDSSETATDPKVCQNDIHSNAQSEIDALIKWLRDEGGFFHPNLEIRSTLNNGYGLFVKEDTEYQRIEEDEQILYIPPDLLLIGPQLRLDSDEVCFLARMLGEERILFKEKESFFAPYIQYLETIAGKANLPATWSQGGKELLSLVIQDDGSGAMIPPVAATSFQEYYPCFMAEYEEEEDDDDDDDEYDKLRDDPEYWNENIAIVLSRAWENVLTPIYDLINHSNDPDKINVKNTAPIQAGRGFSVKSLKVLQPGEEILHSYDRCSHCSTTDSNSGTPELLRDYGFLESYPQRFYFNQHDISIEISQEKNDNMNIEKDGAEKELLFQIDWLNGRPPDDDGRIFLEDLQDHFDSVLNNIIEWKATSDTILDEIPKHEIDTVVEFLNYSIKAVSLVLNAVERINNDTNSSVFQLQEEKYVIESIDRSYQQIYQCNTLVHSFFDYDTIEIMQSAYQQIQYKQDQTTDDICFYLDNVFQMCWSYWPHYHESVVHKTAKYISTEVKRVLWVGGGDSGLLNEILKYPSIELVVGLELDQQVTRLAFKHFAARPHYDNPKVQWWYGDASKTLLMLPKEYFGSFDVVLVDLSDTLFSLSVSAELEVIEALSLLLRPGGVFEMNELFFHKVSNVFEYTIHYQYHDIPKVCDQAMIIASNDLNFLSQGLTDHDLIEDATILVENQSLKTKSQFDYVHDFRHNPNNAYQKLCKQQSLNKENNKTVQDQAPGILMIVEAESLTADLSSSSIISARIIRVLQSVGMHVAIEKDEAPLSDTLMIVMREGYLVARLLPKVKYCALDIHLWSAFDKHDAIKHGIVVDALGGNMYDNSTSSYRIVSGGMFGIPSWQQDEELHGPRVSHSCKRDEPATRGSASDISVFVQALETGLDIAQGRDLVVALFCSVDAAACPSLKVLENHTKVKQVIKLTPCDMVFKNEGEKYKCSMEKAEKAIAGAVKDSNALINAIVFDLNAPFELQDAINIAISDDLLDDENIFVMAAIDEKKQIWRRRIVDAFRSNLGLLDPVSRAHILFNTTTSSLELAVTAAGDGSFFEHLTEAVSKRQKSLSNITIEIRNVFGGKWASFKKEYSSDSEPAQFLREEDYDNSDALLQWRSQKPVAVQVVSQYTNIGREYRVGDIVHLNGGLNSEGRTLWMEVEIVNIDDDGDFDLLFGWGEIDEGVDRENIKHLDENNLPFLLTKEQVIAGCEAAFSGQRVSDFQAYEKRDIGGDGMICTGKWKTGHALVLWDGRFQVDVNVFSFHSLEESSEFENDLLEALPHLVNKLRDVQPRGYGRVVNFMEDIYRSTPQP